MGGVIAVHKPVEVEGRRTPASAHQSINVKVRCIQSHRLIDIIYVYTYRHVCDFVDYEYVPTTHVAAVGSHVPPRGVGGRDRFFVGAVAAEVLTGNILTNQSRW